jgi:low affinity Fe/Cu permease
MRALFRRFSEATSRIVGSSWAFLVAALIVVVWAVTGPLFGFTDTWQLVINTGTTIVTFLMVFLIQNTQNRDSRAIHLKLDELIMGVKGARNRLVDLENMSDEELDGLHKEFESSRQRVQAEVEGRSQRGDTDGDSDRTNSRADPRVGTRQLGASNEAT